MELKSTNSKWIVVYTRPRTERIVASCISELGLESYLPLHKVIRQWSDRKKKIEVPLFPNYVFVKVDSVKRACLYSIKQMVRFVSIEKKPVVVQEKEILTIKKILSENFQVSLENYFQEGMKVRITRGPLAGMNGVIVKKNGANRLIVRIDALMKAYSVNVPTSFTENVTPVTASQAC